VEIIRGKNAVINLAGENPAGVRWTEAKKERIIQSRLTSIDLLSAAINKLDQKDIVYLQSSAIGIYGSRKE
jgi:NAD dependent epimerase/dehydratase family enzyme